MLQRELVSCFTRNKYAQPSQLHTWIGKLSLLWSRTYSSSCLLAFCRRDLFFFFFRHKKKSRQEKRRTGE